MRDPEVNESKYRSRLVDEVKLVGKTLMENADFEHLPIIRRIIKQYPDGVRISCGDVIEWM